MNVNLREDLRPKDQSKDFVDVRWWVTVFLRHRILPTVV